MSSPCELEDGSASPEWQMVESGDGSPPPKRGEMHQPTDPQPDHSLLLLKEAYEQIREQDKNELSSLKLSNHELKSELAAAKATISELISTNNMHMKEMNKQKEETNKVKKVRNKLKREMDEMKEQRNKLKEEMNKLKEKRNKLKEDMAIALLPNLPNTRPSALYSYKMTVDNQFMPFNMPGDAFTAPGLPRNIKAVRELPHGEVVCAVAMAKNSKHVYTGGKGCVKIWDIGCPSVTTPLASLECLKDSYIRSCKLKNDGSVLIAGGESPAIVIWDTERKAVIGELDIGSKACYALAFSEENRLLFTCCEDGNVVIWDLHNRHRLDSLPGHKDGGASCVDLSPDGNVLWTGGLDHTLRSWDLRTRSSLSEVAFDAQIFALACCPTEEYTALGMENNNVEVLHRRRPTDRYRLHRHDSCVLSVKFAHSGNWFCTTGKDNVLNLWRTPYGAGLVRASGNSSVLCCDISTDDQYIVTGSGDQKATVYQVEYN